MRAIINRSLFYQLPPIRSHLLYSATTELRKKKPKPNNQARVNIKVLRKETVFEKTPWLEARLRIGNVNGFSKYLEIPEKRVKKDQRAVRNFCQSRKKESNNG